VYASFEGTKRVLIEFFAVHDDGVLLKTPALLWRWASIFRRFDGPQGLNIQGQAARTDQRYSDTGKCGK